MELVLCDVVPAWLFGVGWRAAGMEEVGQEAPESSSSGGGTCQALAGCRHAAFLPVPCAPSPGLWRFCWAFTRAVARSCRELVLSRGLQGDLCSLSGFPASGKCPGASLGMSQQPILCLQRAPTRPVSCNSGLCALTPCADSYRLFIPFPSESKINCVLCSLLFLVACLDQPRGGCCQTLTPVWVWCCAKTFWGECS